MFPSSRFLYLVGRRECRFGPVGLPLANSLSVDSKNAEEYTHRFDVLFWLWCHVSLIIEAAA